MDHIDMKKENVIDRFNTSSSRTVVTAEIGKSASRMRHLIKHDDGTYRTLFPLETERLNMFPDNWTKSMMKKVNKSQIQSVVS